MSSDPFAGVTDTELWNYQVMLNLACGRNHAALVKKRRQYFCALQKNLEIEAFNRGVPSPKPPHGVGNLKPGAL